MISVVITCHNLDRYIGAAIESVLSQNYTGDMQILVVDDCSTDNSPSVIRSYPAIQYHRTPVNVGVLLATVIGIENSQGSHVFFLDGDDLWGVDKVSKCMAAFDGNPLCSLVTHDLSYIDGNGTEIKRTSLPSVVFANLGTSSFGEKVKNGILMHSDYVWLGSAYAVHRDRADLTGFCQFARSLADSLNTYQDWPLAYWAVAQPEVTAAYVPEKLFSYRLHGVNHSGDATSKEKALRNFRRTLNTMLAIRAIAQRFKVDPAAMQATVQKLSFTQYLDDLYTGQRTSAFKGFFANLSYMCASPGVDLGKEVLRFAGISMLGAGGFIAVLNFLARARRGCR